MPEFMRDQECSVARLYGLFTADCSALLIKQRSRPAQGGIFRRKIDELEVKMLDCPFCERLGAMRIATACNDDAVEIPSGSANRFEAIHSSAVEELSLLFRSEP